MNYLAFYSSYLGCPGSLLLVSLGWNRGAPQLRCRLRDLSHHGPAPNSTVSHKSNVLGTVDDDVTVVDGVDDVVARGGTVIIGRRRLAVLVVVPDLFPVGIDALGLQLGLLGSLLGRLPGFDFSLGARTSLVGARVVLLALLLGH